MSMIGEYILNAGTASTVAQTWVATNRALYIPVIVDVTVTVYQMGFEVGTQSGNCDVGIYDVAKNRLVSAGSTAVAAAGFQAINIADTVLTPGVYFLAMNVDNTTAAVRGCLTALTPQQVCGVQQQAVGAVALPNPCTFANAASVFVPYLTASVVATI